MTMRSMGKVPAPQDVLPDSNDSTRMLHAMMAVTPGAVAFFDSHLRFVRLNKRMAELIGLPAEAVVGKQMAEVLPGWALVLTPAFVRVLQDGQPLMPVALPVVPVALPGGPVDFSVTETSWQVLFHQVLPSGAGVLPGVVAVFDPVPDTRTDSIEREPILSEPMRALVLETATRVATDILASQTGVDALLRIAEAARTLVGARYAALGVAHPRGDGLQEFITTGLSAAEEEAISVRPHGEGILGLLLTRSEPLRIDDIGFHDASVGFPPNHPPMRSFLGVPIRQNGAVLGSLYLTEKENGGTFTEADVVAIQALGAHAAVAIHNLQMLKRQRMLLSGLINAQEEERRAVAYELHDGLTQYVMASHAYLEVFLRAQEAGNTERAAEAIDQVFQYLKQAVIESRRLVNGLRTLALDDLGLTGALTHLLTEEKFRAGWRSAHLEQNIAGRRFDPVLETAAFRVAQEALTNARKHARAEEINVSLLVGNHPASGAPVLTLQVTDNGVGFAPQEKLTEYGRLGLHGMAERVGLLGGTYEVRSTPGAGTVIRAVFPAMEPPDEEESPPGRRT